MHPFALFHSGDAVRVLEGMPDTKWKLIRYDSSSRRLLLGSVTHWTEQKAYLVMHRHSRVRCIIHHAADGPLRIKVGEHAGAAPACSGPAGSRYALSSEPNQLLLEGDDLSLFTFAGGPDDQVPKRGPSTFVPRGGNVEEWVQRSEQLGQRMYDTSKFLSESSDAFEVLRGCSLELGDIYSFTPSHTHSRFRAVRDGARIGEFMLVHTTAIDVLCEMQDVTLRLATEEELRQYMETLPPDVRDWIRDNPWWLGLWQGAYAGRLLMECREGVFGVWADTVFCDWMGSPVAASDWTERAGAEIWWRGPRLDGDWYR